MFFEEEKETRMHVMFLPQRTPWTFNLTGWTGTAPLV